MSRFLADVRFAFRMLAKNRGLATIAVIAFALGIGLTTTTFSIVYGALIKGLRMPCQPSRNATVKMPEAGVPCTIGVPYAFHVSPPSVVASILAFAAEPVAIHARFFPCVATQVPLAANAASPVCAGGSPRAILLQRRPSSVRIPGNRPFTASYGAPYPKARASTPAA